MTNLSYVLAQSRLQCAKIKISNKLLSRRKANCQQNVRDQVQDALDLDKVRRSKLEELLAGRSCIGANVRGRDHSFGIVIFEHN
jgi:hypothetical protein